MTPDDLAAIRAYADPVEHEHVLALADALEQAWAERDAMAYTDVLLARVGSAEAALARVRALCEQAERDHRRACMAPGGQQVTYARVYVSDVMTEILRAAIEGP